MGEVKADHFLVLSKGIDRQPDTRSGGMNLVEQLNMQQIFDFTRDMEASKWREHNYLLTLPGDKRFYSNPGGWLAPLAELAPSKNPPAFRKLN